MSGVVLGLPAIARSDLILGSREPPLHDLATAPITQTLVRALPVLHAVSGLVVSMVRCCQLDAAGGTGAGAVKVRHGSRAWAGVSVTSSHLTPSRCRALPVAMFATSPGESTLVRCVE